MKSRRAICGREARMIPRARSSIGQVEAMVFSLLSTRGAGDGVAAAVREPGGD